MDDDMFIGISHQELRRSLAHSTVCSRCGALIVYLDALELHQLHDAWHQRNDHTGWVPDNDADHW